MGPRINHVSATARIPATTANDDPAAANGCDHGSHLATRNLVARLAKLQQQGDQHAGTSAEYGHVWTSRSGPGWPPVHASRKQLSSSQHPTRSAADAAADAAAKHGHAAAEHDEQRHPPCAARVRTAAYGIRQPGHGPWRPPRRKDEEDEEGLPRWKEAQGIQGQALLKAVLDFALMLAPIKSNP